MSRYAARSAAPWPPRGAKRLHGAGACAAVGAALLGVSAQPAGAAREPLPAPELRAKAAIVIDAASGDALLEERADDRRPVASATKLMTALLALERSDLDDVFTAPAYQALPVESKIGLRAGERMSVRDLLAALLLESANDAAVTIAVNVAGSRASFVREMNLRARRLGLGSTRFANPIGFDDPRNFSTARDLAKLARQLMRDSRFARVADLPYAVLRSGSRRRVVINRNRLVRRFPFVDGVKTGRTQGAGYVLVGSATGQGARVISVVLGAPTEAARDADSIALLRFGVDRFERIRILAAGEELARVPVKHRGGDQAILTTPADLFLTIRRGRRVEKVVQAPDELDGPLPAGRRVGSVTVVYGGRPARRAPLVTAEAVPGAGLVRRLGSAVGVSPASILVILGLTSIATLVILRVRATRMRRPRPTRA